MSSAFSLMARTLAATGLMMGLAAPPASAALLILVNAEADAPDGVPGDGRCSAAGPPTIAGRCTLRAAIEEANASDGDDYIYLPAGTYRLTFLRAGKSPGSDRSLEIRSSLHLTGEGADHTIIDAGGLGRVMVVQRRGRAGLWPSVHIEGVTLTGGRAATGQSGGGLYVVDAIVFLRACVIFKNEADFGGGIASSSGIWLSHVTIAGNEAKQGGGAWFGRGGYNVDDTIVSQNRADEGGGIHLGFGVLMMKDGEITGNTAAFRGGGLFLQGGGRAPGPASAAHFDRVRVVKNEAGSGGGVYADVRVIRLRDSEVSGNSASDDGGGLLFPASTDTSELASGEIRDSSISHNQAGRDGGGLSNGIALNIYNSTISGNQAGGKGGGFVNLGGLVDVAYATIYSNTAMLGGGFVAEDRIDGAHFAAVSPVSYRNSIIAGNESGSCRWFRLGRDGGVSPITSLGYNLLDDSRCSRVPGRDRFTTDDPRLAPLAPNGGPTLNHLPQFGSPAIDAIPISTITDCWARSVVGRSLRQDQRGIDRPQGPGCDIGAVEASQIGEPPQP